MKGSLRAILQLCFPRTTSERLEMKWASSFSSLSLEVGLEEVLRFLGME